MKTIPFTEELTPEQLDNLFDWLFALRSGEFKQARSTLRRVDGSCCCLGVACEINQVPCKLTEDATVYQYDFDGYLNYSSPRRDWFERIFGFSYSKTLIHKNDECLEIRSLMHLNDTLEFTFEQIAMVLECVFIYKIEVEL